ncbi:hypothetical protein [Chromohalobacter israelensis]|uniref:hypothetical protein n=1 Tax=Chromohalobacter israelensis TaxID=141390 RepID=UPI00265B97A7|nr:hypothetical protein [Chromohalobacter salexigens]MDO0944136.1 hypothetical protein [Chromohalobacter salexigens]
MSDSFFDTFDIDLSQSQRLLTLDIAGASFIPHRLVGEDRVSAPFIFREASRRRALHVVISTARAATLSRPTS